MLRSMLSMRRMASVSSRSPTSVSSTFSSVKPRQYAKKVGVKKASVLQSADTRWKKIRNIGISAHIDSGKTTLTERILFYAGRIKEIHEVRGKDGIGAKMDSMALEREKGITIKSAATYIQWNKHHINIIDTPGHVDFTIEVERALRVLDGAVLVLCSVGGIQSQTYTVDRQMKRYKVPRLVFINKLDRLGAAPWKCMEGLTGKLGLNPVPVMMPMGVEKRHVGVIDILTQKSLTFGGEDGDEVIEDDIPPNFIDEAIQRREKIVEVCSDLSDEVMELVLAGEPVPTPLLKKVLRQATLNHKVVPVFMGSAIKNKGVQPLLDGITDYLPNPSEVENTAFKTVLNKEKEKEEKEFVVENKPKESLLAYAFKLEENVHGQLTWLRVYRGIIAAGSQVFNTSDGTKVKVNRLVRMNSDEIEDTQQIGAGDIAATYGIDCSTGDTFVENKEDQTIKMTSMHVPDPVLSLSLTTAKDKTSVKQAAKALRKFQREDPTFRVGVDKDTQETIISGMGELHLEIYVERLKREYGVNCKIGRPLVNYRETITEKKHFEYLHKKQTGGSGQYAKVIGYLEPIDEDEEVTEEFVDTTVGGTIPPQFIPAIRKGYEDCIQAGYLIGFPVHKCRMVVSDGDWHAVDSSEQAFRTCTHHAFREAFKEAGPTLLQPIMRVEVVAPNEFQGAVIGSLHRRKAGVNDSEMGKEFCTIEVEAPLNNMFGYATELRSITQGKGEFVMEYDHHDVVSEQERVAITNQLGAGAHQRRKAAGN